MFVVRCCCLYRPAVKDLGQTHVNSSTQATSWTEGGGDGLSCLKTGAERAKPIWENQISVGGEERNFENGIYTTAV